jgi:hypothetical protein
MGLYYTFTETYKPIWDKKIRSLLVGKNIMRKNDDKTETTGQVLIGRTHETQRLVQNKK